MLNFQWKQIREIDRIPPPSREEFEQRYMAARRPVIITGVVTEWPAFRDWDLEGLRDKAGDQTIQVRVSSSEVFKSQDEKKGMAGLPAREMAMAEYLDWLEQRPSGTHYYLQQQSLLRELEVLRPDVEVPGFIADQDLRHMNVWIGAGGNVTPLHCDAMDNLLCQIRGAKRLLLFPPSEYRNLYPHSPFSQMPVNLSRVDLDDPDLERFPRFSRARPLEVELQAGDMLFLPVFWWHWVQGIDLNVAVNLWWKPRWQHLWFPPDYVLRGRTMNLVRRLRSRSNPKSS